MNRRTKLELAMTISWGYATLALLWLGSFVHSEVVSTWKEFPTVVSFGALVIIAGTLTWFWFIELTDSII